MDLNMRAFLSKNSSKVILGAFIAGLGGCTAIPEYKQSAKEADSAFIVPNLTTSKMISSAASVDIVNGPAVCGEAFPEPKRVFRLSQRNPLINILNADGAWIPAGQPLNLVAMLLMDGGQCVQAVSFVPEQGKRYRLNMYGKSALSAYALPNCEVSVIRIDNAGKDLGPVTDLKALPCIEKNGVK